MIVFVAAIFILAVVYSVFSASTLSGTQLGVGTSTPGAALSVRGGLLVAGGDVQILGGPLNVGFILATSTTASSFVGSVGVGTTSPGATLSVRGGLLVAGGDAQILGGPLNVGFILATSTTASSFVGNVGVGTTTPGATLSVRGEALIDGRLTTNFLTATSTTATSSIAYGLTVVTSGGTFGIGTTTPGLNAEVGIVGDIYQSSGGTTTETRFSTSATQGGCIELEAPDGTWLRVYAGRGSQATTSTGAIGLGLVFQEGRCQ